MLKYVCKHICIHNKGLDQIFIQYLGISVEDFISFLRHFEYPISLLDHVLTNKKRYNDISHEITVVYDKTTQQVVRTSFYGIV